MTVTLDKLALQALGDASGLNLKKQFFSDAKECDASVVEAVSPVSSVPMFAALMSYGTSTSCQHRQRIP